MSDNGYDVVNIGIGQPISAILDVACEQAADVIGMSGLLVKSTVVMRDNLAELNSRGLARRWPVVLGGAALTRAYVEQDLAGLFDGEVRYARDAFEGLRLMDAFMAVKRGARRGAELPAPAHPPGALAAAARLRLTEPEAMPALLGRGGGQLRFRPRRSWGARVVKGIQLLADYAALPGRAGHVHGPVGAQANAGRERAVL